MTNNYNITFETIGNPLVDFSYRLEDTIFDKIGNKTTWVGVFVFEDENSNTSKYLPIFIRRARDLLGFIPLQDWKTSSLDISRGNIYYFSKNNDKKNDSRDKLLRTMRSSNSASEYKIYCENKEIICNDVFCYGIPLEDRFIKLSREVDVAKISNFNEVTDKALGLIKQKVDAFKQ